MGNALTRRTLLQTTAATAAGSVLGVLPALAEEATPQVSLRLLETSDLHMFVLDWDYYHVKPDPTVGFAKVATLIETARAEATNTLLFDNGDFLQGSPLGDYIAEKAKPATASTGQGLHPIVGIMGSLLYDAATLGNHEFNYGLDFLEAGIANAPFPFVCANIMRAGGSQFLPPYAVLERTLRDASGAPHTLRIGVIGFVPPQIMNWDKVHLTGKLETGDILAAAKRYVPELRAKCDVLVALSHSGISAGPYVEGQENASYHISSVPGIDIIFTGHAHRVFPGRDYEGLQGIDAAAGRLGGVPAIMPGFWGSHLGVADLTLSRKGSTWTVDKAAVETRPIYKREGAKVEELAKRDEAVAAAIAAPHKEALVWVEQPVGVLDAPVHSYFALVGHDPASALVNAAESWYVAPLLAGTPFAGMPLLASVGAFRAGYTPDSFIDIAAGPMALRQVADLYMYTANTVVAVKVTGAQVLEWLEFSARVFNTIDPAASGLQALIDKRVSSYNFDIISGLTYSFDVSKPPRYDKDGKQISPARRVTGLQFEDKPMPLDREFVVVTNNYRADGGGSFPSLAGATIALRAPDTNRDAIVRYIKSAATTSVPKADVWGFAPLGRPVTVYLDSGKAAVAHLGEVGNVTQLGDGEPGYLRLGVALI